jgi:hypothetical protein
MLLEIAFVVWQCLATLEFWTAPFEKCRGKVNAVRMSDLFAANVFDCVNCVSK